MVSRGTNFGTKRRLSRSPSCMSDICLVEFLHDRCALRVKTSKRCMLEILRSMKDKDSDPRGCKLCLQSLLCAVFDH